MVIIQVRFAGPRSAIGFFKCLCARSDEGPDFFCRSDYTGSPSTYDTIGS